MNTRLSTVQASHVVDFISHSDEQTVRVGQKLASLLRRGDIILLRGELGAGKTHLVKGIALGLGAHDLVTSPTFVLVNEYSGSRDGRRLPIYHIDLYRLQSGADVETFAFDELLDTPDGICLIEWPERAEDYLPAERLGIEIGYLSDTKRVIRLNPAGARYADLVATFRRAAFG